MIRRSWSVPTFKSLLAVAVEIFLCSIRYSFLLNSRVPKCFLAFRVRSSIEGFTGRNISKKSSNYWRIIWSENSMNKVEFPVASHFLQVEPYAKLRSSLRTPTFPDRHFPAWERMSFIKILWAFSKCFLLPSYSQYFVLLSNHYHCSNGIISLVISIGIASSGKFARVIIYEWFP